jgi:hypothetical protein
MSNTVLGLAVIYVLKLSSGASDLSANVAGYAVGMAVSYVAQALGIIPYSVSGFIGAKYFVFASAREQSVLNTGVKH